MKTKTTPREPMTREMLDTWARKIIHAVHRADESQKGPFKDDSEYSAYLFNVSRELFSFHEQSLRGKYE